MVGKYILSFDISVLYFPSFVTNMITMLPPGALKVEYIKLNMQWKQSNRFVEILPFLHAIITKLTDFNFDVVDGCGFILRLVLFRAQQLWVLNQKTM